jgi:uncharacterized protein
MTNVIRRHPLASFYIIACLLAPLAIPVFILASPAAEPIITQSGIAFRTSYVVVIQLLHYALSLWPLMAALIYHPLTPTISVLIVVSICGGRPALRELFARLRPWQSNVGTSTALAWWAVAMGTGVAISLGIAVIQYANAAPGTFKWTPGQFGVLPPLAWFLAAMFTDGGGCGEELGWRGFALPYLQARYSPLKSALVLGVMWSAWHWSTVVLNYLDNLQALFPYLITFTMFCIALTIVMTFFSNKLGGSALVAVMLHGLANDSMQLKGVVTGQGAIVEGTLLISMPCIVVATIIVVATKGRLGFDSEEPERRIWSWLVRSATKQPNVMG